MKQVDISANQYTELLKHMVQNTNIYKMFNSYNHTTNQQKISVVMSIIFYIFQIYSNIISCITFYQNIHNISEFIEKYKQYCKRGIKQINDINYNLKKYSSYKLFIETNEKHRILLETIVGKIEYILPYKNTISKLSQIGYIMTLYYDLYYNDAYDKCFYYTNNLNEYVKDILSINKLYTSKHINKCKFTNDVTKFTDLFYLEHINTKHIKNSICIDKNIMITGPNASGKTTIIKSVLLNIIMSQQFGLGCYKKGQINVYEYFHSYLNIPDTSGRDSLFQAEARRCKDILETIEENKNDRHFCIFDELYSGTNPNDAILCAKIYLKGLFMFKNIDFMLTTHYIDMCEYFNKDIFINNIKNIKMDVNENIDDIEYTYKIKDGISYVHGVKQVLKDLNYPSYLFTL